ncbi:MAG: hydroxylamine reductase [Actinomycetota bacterium]|jgi:hydroxylamine reductase|nr:hydroxylamine reductase [Actinomycetota bacterium]
MFCNQCEQTSKGVGCTTRAVCGKSPEVSDLQDLLVNMTRGIAPVAIEAEKVGVNTAEAAHFIADALFTTLTNVDFDADSIAVKIDDAARLRGALKAAVMAAGGVAPAGKFVDLAPAASVEAKEAQAAELGSPWDTTRDEDVQSLQQTTLYGLKGIGSYAHHATTLGQEDPEIGSYLFKALASLEDTTLGLTEWVALALECGKINLRTMEILDAGNTGTFGHPTPTEVPLGHRPNKAILVSGHDLADIAAVLEQTAGKGIDVYTHGEMLPTHAYPELKKHAHFYGHFGTAWQNQHKEFAAFPGAILMTTNCLMPPKDEYAGRLFTSGPVQFAGIPHVGREDLSSVVAKALEMDGFTDETDNSSVMVGFGRNTVLGVAPQVIEAVKSGAIKHFFLVGGCDGAKPGRNYYTDFVEQAPADTIVMTLACGKFRFFDKKLGDIGGIPRLLDVGQCNDAYSAVQIALALADAFDVGVNELPLSIVLSWYEQKAVAILLSLLYLGITDMRLGPTLPAFITPNVLQVLVDNFGIMPIGESAADDLKAILGDEAVA